MTMTRIKKLLRENKGFLFFLFGMVLVRSAVADWYGVPSGSMYPTLMIGDRIIADRLAYDVKIPFTDVIVKHIADPKRGDIVTFSSPEDGIRLVKRIIGLPGDIVEMRGEELIINGEPASYAAADAAFATQLSPDYAGRQLVLNEKLPGIQHPIIVMPERFAARSFGPVTVPPGQYLMLGDNRDASKDSRYIGFVKRELITGQVKRVAFSVDTGHFYLPRSDRFGTSLQ
ncbi:MAG TPA: signal peptidase I [Noviherbaspirillum sp.]|uniref:signal peptidase I n=1 Tax=Noviherbaspirillum sp. TaxID=1926288 RepID=UPI002B473B92|nr:signal peptidase I [Noviherbaspirillum sp.]HJV85459.1 signal peptidase I [Noviherbaspirillum sp.]